MSATTEVHRAISESVPERRDWWRIGDGVVLVVYATVVLWTLRYHEKWADEAQSWLMARDLSLRTIWFHELRYEGSPGLWHTMLWVAQHVFHLGYGALGYIGALLAIGGATVLLFFAPFPRYVRWPLVFTYVMVYQYAVIARPYTMLPLLAFLAAIFFRDLRHPERLTAVLVLLCLLTMHGIVLAACVAVAFVVRLLEDRATLGVKLRRRYLLCVSTMLCVLVFLFVILRPTPDVEEIALRNQVAHAPAWVQAQFPTLGTKLTAVISGAFLDWFVPSMIFWVLLAAWTLGRRRSILFTLATGLLIAFYGLVHGAAHHHGTVFIAAIAGLWVAWPEGERRRDRRELAMVEALLLVLMGINIWDSAVVIGREYLYPYCGADDAARYLRAVGADQGPMFGLLFGVVAVQAQFDHNIFINNPTSYFHHGLPLATTTLDVDLLRRAKPEYVVAYSNDPKQMVATGVPELTTRGYQLAHFADGYYLYKRSVFEREVYFIFKRLPDPVKAND
jgi:hypothetical protein